MFVKTGDNMSKVSEHLNSLWNPSDGVLEDIVSFQHSGFHVKSHFATQVILSAAHVVANGSGWCEHGVFDDMA